MIGSQHIEGMRQGRPGPDGFGVNSRERDVYSRSKANTSRNRKAGKVRRVKPAWKR